MILNSKSNFGDEDDELIDEEEDEMEGFGVEGEDDDSGEDVEEEDDMSDLNEIEE